MYHLRAAHSVKWQIQPALNVLTYPDECRWCCSKFETSEAELIFTEIATAAALVVLQNRNIAQTPR